MEGQEGTAHPAPGRTALQALQWPILGHLSSVLSGFSPAQHQGFLQAPPHWHNSVSAWHFHRGLGDTPPPSGLHVFTLLYKSQTWGLQHLDDPFIHKYQFPKIYMGQVIQSPGTGTLTQCITTTTFWLHVESLCTKVCCNRKGYSLPAEVPEMDCCLGSDRA